jgi:hypothetical protein
MGAQPAGAVQHRAVRVFVSYAHRDGEECRAFVVYLANLRRQGLIDLWWDESLLAGEWHPDILQRLNRADLILLLVTPEYIASENCEAEYLRALERHEAFKQRKPGGARVVPIWLKTADYKGSPFGKLTPFPRGNRPIDRYLSREIGFEKALEGIREVVDEIRDGGLVGWTGADDSPCNRLISYAEQYPLDERGRFLPHLCDRTDPELAVREGLLACATFAGETDAKGGRRALAYLVPAFNDDCPEGFHLRLSSRVFPGLAGVPGIAPIPIDWPAEYRKQEEAKSDFRLRLSARLACDPARLKETLNDRPVTLVRTTVDHHQWQNHGRETLTGFLRFCETLRGCRGIVIAEAVFQLLDPQLVEAPESPLWRRWLGLAPSHAQVHEKATQSNHEIQTTLEGLAGTRFAAYPDLRGAVAKLIPITWGHASVWLGDVDVRAWCAPNTETDMSRELSACMGQGVYRMGMILPSLDGLLGKYRRAS